MLLLCLLIGMPIDNNNVLFHHLCKYEQVFSLKSTFTKQILLAGLNTILPLLIQNYNWKVQNSDLETPLHLIFKKWKIFKLDNELLLQILHISNINIVNKEGMSAVHYFYKYQVNIYVNQAINDYMTKHGNFNLQDGLGICPLQYMTPGSNALIENEVEQLQSFSEKDFWNQDSKINESDEELSLLNNIR